ncbi:hypothetical protein LCGC14_0519530 [marine sediment metagenome]|uniref:Uncharacterized protein n=1 Tax=marine sediment metagenome TaxID=412755 RepID=A0A0F9V722_9ZZZZ|nr:MAG: hypothetical protein Lokiarch_48590 [Candidatus Lokiarchaeum sp. GC14_75]HEC36807.1 hypothetical protein [bacterium]
MDSRRNPELARKFIIANCNDYIRDIFLDKDRPVIKIVFHKEIYLYLRYNDYGEYSYSTIFSPNPDDQIRFDNYDDIWKVKTRPHHFHIRGMKKVIESPMKGEPEHDIPILLTFVLKNSKN